MQTMDFANHFIRNRTILKTLLENDEYFFIVDQLIRQLVALNIFKILFPKKK